MNTTVAPRIMPWSCSHVIGAKRVMYMHDNTYTFRVPQVLGQELMCKGEDFWKKKEDKILKPCG